MKGTVFMRPARFALLLPLLWSSYLFADAHGLAVAGPSPDEAYQQLIDGHARYTSNARTLAHQDEARRCETTTGGQHPIAAVLACADSRVPPELLFDQGIGDLFVIRVAGNVAAADELGTLEYGVEHLKIPLIVVLGHGKCGAVTAVVDGAHAEGNLAELLQPITPAAARARQLHPTYKGPQLVGSAIQENVRQQITTLSGRSPVLAKAITSGRVKVVGGVYDIHAGQVEWLQSVSLAAGGASEPESSPTAARHTEAPSSEAPHGQAAHGDHAAPVTEPAGHGEHDVHSPHAAAKAVKPVAAMASHAVVDLTEDAHDSVITPKSKPAKSAVKPVTSAHEEAEEDHGPSAAAHDGDEHPAKPLAAKAVKADKADAGTVGTSLADHWPVLSGVAVASTLIGAAITRFAPKHAA
jgi:carbonic anhydrase